MLNSRARRLRFATACLALTVMWGQPARAETISDLIPDDIETTLSGSYLAAMSAAKERDLEAATIFFQEALSRDPKNLLLLDRTFTLLIATGKVEQAFPIAERLVATSDVSRMGEIALALRALKNKNYRESSERLGKGDQSQFANLTASVLAAWAAQGQGETDGALRIIETTQGPSWFDTFKQFNTALILDVSGKTDEALAAIKKAYENDPSAMRIVEAYARMMARAGHTKEAEAALDKFAKTGVAQPLVLALRNEIAAGRKPAPLVSNAAEGAAEVLYGLGSAVGGERGGDELGVVYLRLALYLNPHSNLALMALAEIQQNGRDFAQSNKTFARVSKSSPLRRTAEMQIAFNMDALGKRQDAIKQLKKLAASDPKDMDVLSSLGTLYRGDKHYQEAINYYTKALDLITPGDPRLSMLLYFRGIAYERANEWPKAEADFRAALKLSPNEPQILNYLGYSLVDKGIDVDEGTELIKKAVNLKPDDGYIVDSLGWAYYKLGHYDQAVAQLERAVTLLPEDATINDHLGDAYWKVGRKLEATFQWTHARDLGPEPADKQRILDKLAKGLDRVEEASAAQPTRVASASGNVVTDATMASAAAPIPPTVTVQAGDSLWKIADKFYGNGEFYNRLIEANRSKIPDPNQIEPGLVIELPPVDGVK